MLLTLHNLPVPERGVAAREHARASGAVVDRVRVVTFAEGEGDEMLHKGPYSEEKATLDAMTELMDQHGLIPHGLHHEICLTAFDDPNPKTMLRQPVVSSAL